MSNQPRQIIHTTTNNLPIFAAILNSRNWTWTNFGSYIEIEAYEDETESLIAEVYALNV